MTDQRATPEQWGAMYEGAFHCDAESACILELRTRVEALEAAKRPASKVHEISEPLQLTPEQAQQVRDLLAPNSKPTPNFFQIRSSLVERVDGALMDSVKEQGSMARAAIREVAAWLIDRKRDDDWLAPFEQLADLLLEEAQR